MSIACQNVSGTYANSKDQWRKWKAPDVTKKRLIAIFLGNVDWSISATLIQCQKYRCVAKLIDSYIYTPYWVQTPGLSLRSGCSSRRQRNDVLSFCDMKTIAKSHYVWKDSVVPLKTIRFISRFPDSFTLSTFTAWLGVYWSAIILNESDLGLHCYKWAKVSVSHTPKPTEHFSRLVTITVIFVGCHEHFDHFELIAIPSFSWYPHWPVLIQWHVAVSKWLAANRIKGVVGINLIALCRTGALIFPNLRLIILDK